MIYPNLEVKEYLKQYFSVMNKEFKANGLIHGVKILKQMRLHITRYICGNPLYVNNMCIGIDKTG